MNGNRLKKLRQELGLTQSELGQRLGVVKQTISSWENNVSVPSGDTLLRLAKCYGVSVDEILGREDNSGDGVASSFEYSGGDEAAFSFPHKLANQIDFNGTKIRDLAIALGVSEKTIVYWLSGQSDDYKDYYQKLSDYFKVCLRYWTSPHALSPGIEPNMDEYLLILLYREYKETHKLNDVYGSLEYFFPGLNIIEDSQRRKFLSIFDELNEDNRDIIVGEIKKCIKEQRNEVSVATDSTLRKAK